MNLSITAEKILGRKIESREGITPSDIENTEKEFYLTLGNVKLFTDGFQHFADLSELLIKDTKLVFLQEHQSVIYWAVDLTDGNTIFQTTDQDFDKNVTWHKEDFDLSDLLEMMLFFQCVMSDESYHITSNSGFQYFASLDGFEYQKNKEKIDFVNHLEAKFERVFDKPNMSIYWKEDSIIMLLMNTENTVDTIFSCIKNEPSLELLISTYHFSEL